MPSNFVRDGRLMQAGDWAEVQHFKPQEFQHPEKMGRSFIFWLDRVRSRAGCKMRITSSWRSPQHNEAVGGAKNSAHMDEICQAIDTMPESSEDRFAIVNAALAEGGQRIGIYQDGSIHLDRTEDVRPAPVIWTVVNH